MSTQTTGTEARRHEGCSFKSILREVRGNQVKRPGSLFLVEFYTRRRADGLRVSA